MTGPSTSSPKFGLSDALILAAAPVIGAAFQYSRVRGFVEYFGAPAWYARADFANVALVVLPLVGLLFFGVLAYLLGSNFGRLAAVTFTLTVGVLYGVILGAAQGASTLTATWPAVVGVTATLLVPAVAGMAWKQGWGSRLPADTRNALQRVGWWAVGTAVLGVAGTFFFSWLGRLDAGSRRDFLLTDGSPRWVILQRQGDHLLGGQLDTASGDLLGRYTLLPATGDSAPTVTLCTLGPFARDSAARATEAADTLESGVPRWRSLSHARLPRTCLRRRGPQPGTKRQDGPDSVSQSCRCCCAGCPIPPRMRHPPRRECQRKTQHAS